MALAVEANRRQQDRGREVVGTAADILRLYAALIGDVPYESMTLAMVEDDLPGGHAPAYFAMLNNPPPVTPFMWRNDPAMFSNFPEFFLAHEIAHQWWGQAVGWKNYHEQWLSEGFAQYFAALYARERRGEGRSATCCASSAAGPSIESDQGAVYLGYRLGHIKGDSRVFRALVYNKGAAVLHMLRRWSATRCSFAGCGGSTPTTASRRPAPTICNARWKRRASSRWSGSSSAGSTNRRCHACAMPPARAARRSSCASSRSARSSMSR